MSTKRYNLWNRGRKSGLLTALLFVGALLATVNAVQSVGNKGSTRIVIEEQKSAPMFGVAVNAQLVVLEVYPQMAASRSGIEPGDVLLSINGAVVTEGRSAVAVFQRAAVQQEQDRRPSQLVLKRNDRVMAVDLRLLPPGATPQPDHNETIVLPAGAEPPAEIIETTDSAPTPTPARGDIYYL